MATKEFKKGDVVIFIPQTLIISESKIIHNPINQKIISNTKFSENLNSLQHTLGQVWLTEAMNEPNSSLKPFLDILPEDVSEFPIMFGQEEKNLLQGSNLLVIIEKTYSEIKDDYDLLCEIPSFKTNISWTNFLKTRMLIQSRIFSYEKGSETCMSMVPFADLLNHDKPR